MTDAVFIATLGAEPQVVTLTLDTLLERTIPITQVVVAHTDASREPIHGAVPGAAAGFRNRARIW